MGLKECYNVMIMVPDVEILEFVLQKNKINEYVLFYSLIQISQYKNDTGKLKILLAKIVENSTLDKNIFVLDRLNHSIAENEVLPVVVLTERQQLYCNLAATVPATIGYLL
jgi:hypothetical protein